MDIKAKVRSSDHSKSNLARIRYSRGHVMILDAIIAISLLAVIYLAFISSYEPTKTQISESTFKDVHYVSEDVLDVLNKKGVLDEVGAEWAAADGNISSIHWSNATNISREYLDKLIPEKMGYRVIIDEVNVIYDSNNDSTSNRPREEGADIKTHSSRLLVGYSSGLPVRGHVARAYLTNIREKTTSRYTYFGGFEGQGNLSKTVSLPSGVDTVKSICMEYVAGDDFNLAIDGNPVTEEFNRSVDNMTATSACILNPETYITTGGNHTFDISFKNPAIVYQFIGGGYIRIMYNTSVFDTTETAGTMYHKFPGINGMINVYSSFFIPGTLNTANVHLKFYNNYTTFLTFGNVTLLDTSQNASRDFCTINSNEYTCDIPNANITEMLNDEGLSYTTDLSENTIPVRLGVMNVSGTVGIGAADVILITDVSGSMRWQVGSSAEVLGTNRSCTSPDLYDADTRRISLAKCLDKDFINTILNSSGNRIGLVSFNDAVDDWHELSSDADSLISQIDGYSDLPSGGTCVCCAINKAMDILESGGTVVPRYSVWLTYKKNGCGNSCDPWESSCTPPTDWNNLSFSETHWNNAYMPDVYSFDSRRDRYYRKHFTLSTLPTANATLSVRNRRGVECYVNGYFVGHDGSCSTGSYWDNVWNVDKSYFRLGDNVIACRIKAGGPSWSWTTIGAEFDAELYMPALGQDENRSKFIIVMTDGITGYHCGNCGAPATCSGSCTATVGSPNCGGGSVDCFGPQCDDAIEDAICASCSAHNDYNATVHAIGFGPVITCSNANYTLNGIAACGNGSYYGSMNATELRMIYQNIAAEIANVTYESQSMDIVGNFSPSILYPESYIRFTYNPSANFTYGDITLTQDTETFNDTSTCTGTFYVSSIAEVTEIRATSYSSDHWTDYLTVNGETPPVYSLRDQRFGSDYLLIGDPYAVQIPPGLIYSGIDNDITIGTGDGPEPPYTGCSRDNRAIYTIRLSGRVGYGNVFLEKSGCNWTIQFEDDTNITENIPDYYNGTKKCLYSAENVSFDRNDAIDDAIYRVLQMLDSNANNKSDIEFDSTMIQFDFSRAGGVRSLWGPITVKLVVWM